MREWNGNKPAPVDNDRRHEASPQQEIENKRHRPAVLPPRGSVLSGGWEGEQRNPDLEAVAESHHRSLKDVLVSHRNGHSEVYSWHVLG